MKKILLAILYIIYGINSFAGTTDPDTSDNKYIEYGKKFHSVVKLCCSNTDGLSCGSAVIIYPKWIVTAAHIVEKQDKCSIIINDNKYNIDQIFIHNDYKPNVFGSNDIALGLISSDIKLEYYPELYSNNDESGKLCSISGWGLTGNFHTGLNIYDGKRRAGSNFIDHVDNNIIICSPSKKYQKITELEFLICSGDSGGGLFIGNKLAGINSSVMSYDNKPDSTYGDESRHTRISSHRDWILNIIENNK
jgi:hypothetical protein